MAYGTPVAVAGDSDVFCLKCAMDRYGEQDVEYFVNHDRVYMLYGHDGEALEVAREGMHDRFLCGLWCECGTALCPYADYGCSCVEADEEASDAVVRSGIMASLACTLP